MPRTLFLGTPFERYEQTHLLEQVGDLRDLINQAQKTARAEEIDLVCITNISPSHPTYRTWLNAGFVPLPSFPDMTVDLEGINSFDEHLARIPPGDRGSVRRNTRKFQRLASRSAQYEKLIKSGPSSGRVTSPSLIAHGLNGSPIAQPISVELATSTQRFH